MKIYSAFAFAAFVSAISGVAQPRPADPATAEKKAIVALGDAWAERFNAHNAKGLADLFTEDCVRMPNEAKTTLGRQALANAYAKEFASAWKNGATVMITTEEIVLAGIYAFARGADSTTEVTNGKTTTDIGKWLAVYRRESNGDWKFYWSTYNRNHPADAASR